MHQPHTLFDHKIMNIGDDLGSGHVQVIDQPMSPIEAILWTLGIL